MRTMVSDFNKVKIKLKQEIFDFDVYAKKNFLTELLLFTLYIKKKKKTFRNEKQLLK